MDLTNLQTAVVNLTDLRLALGVLGIFIIYVIFVTIFYRDEFTNWYHHYTQPEPSYLTKTRQPGWHMPLPDEAFERLGLRQIAMLLCIWALFVVIGACLGAVFGAIFVTLGTHYSLLPRGVFGGAILGGLLSFIAILIIYAQHHRHYHS
ncbi:MAG TPA: hypothetical protein VLL52_16530 [Anaerolineae bacterium]|nr:hypothetical protein [Anaerolineae bacterium]